MTNVDDYFRQQLSNVVAEVQCNKLSHKLVQSYWNYKRLIGCKDYLYNNNSPYPKACDHLYDLCDSLHCRYSVSDVAIRDMRDIYKGKKLPRRTGRLMDNGKFKYEYLNQVNKILDDTTHYFGTVWPTEVLIEGNSLDFSSFTSRRNDVVNKRSLCWVRMNNILHVQLSLNLDTLNPKEELIRLKNVGKKMKEIVKSAIK